MPEPRGRRRIGAYILAADPTWLRSSIARYYDHLDVLVVSAASDDVGWTGAPIRASECASLVRSIDERRIVRTISGRWRSPVNPMHADTAQRQAALDALAGEVDWVLQIDADEVLPSWSALERMLAHAEAAGIGTVEWPMRVLYRRLRSGRYLEVTGPRGQPHYEYPGPIAVRPSARLTDARRTSGPILRPVVVGDDCSSQLQAPPAEGETRVAVLSRSEAIIHNSWARDAHSIRAKVRSWGHNQGVRSWVYYYRSWFVAPVRWRRMRQLHPLVPQQWPALSMTSDDVESLLLAEDRAIDQTKRFA